MDAVISIQHVLEGLLSKSMQLSNAIAENNSSFIDRVLSERDELYKRLEKLLPSISRAPNNKDHLVALLKQLQKSEQQLHDQLTSSKISSAIELKNVLEEKLKFLETETVDIKGNRLRTTG